MVTHRFGGAWTERKLQALGNYLKAYQQIFTANPQARALKTIYLDAFAGTGDRDPKAKADQSDSLFEYPEEAQEFKQGSARVALSLENKFGHYIFIDRKAQHLNALRHGVEKDLPDLVSICEFVNDDANAWLRNWCARQDWRSHRAVVFLDPYGMSVEWATIVAIAKTKAIDMWFLFPYAIGVNRMMPKEGLPETVWGKVLTRVFGTSDWVGRFYVRQQTKDLFGHEQDSVTRNAEIEGILEFFLERLRGIFPHVVKQPLILTNSNNSPMYALCFAAGNPKGGATALRIASHLTRTT